MSKIGQKFSSGSANKIGQKFSQTSPVRMGTSGVRTTTGAVRRSGSLMGNFMVIVLFTIFVVIILLLRMEIHVSIILFVISTIGIGVSMLLSKPEMTPEDKLRESTINEFQVPNTKTALMEFTLLATQKIQPVSSVKAMIDQDAKRQQWLNKIWSDKCRGIYNRAMVAMSDDKSSLNTIAQLMTKAGVKI